MQPPRPDRDQDLDSRLPDPDLLSLHPARANAYSRGRGNGPSMRGLSHLFVARNKGSGHSGHE